MSKLSLCSVKGLVRSRGMYQPLRGIKENFSSICRASLQTLSALHWRWRENISCALLPSPSWKTPYQNEQAPSCPLQQQQLHRAAWLCRWLCHYKQRGNPVPETAAPLCFTLCNKVPGYPLVFHFKVEAQAQGTASELHPFWSLSLKDHCYLFISGSKCQNIIPLSMATG